MNFSRDESKVNGESKVTTSGQNKNQQKYAK